MGNFFYKLRCALARFLYGRNGVDQLCHATLYALLGLCILSMFLQRIPILSRILSFAELLLWIVLMVRMLSKNLDKRRAENARFMAWWGPKKAGLLGAKSRRADTAHKYVRCSCGAYCRVPRGVGKVELTCPKCGAKKITKA